MPAQYSPDVVVDPWWETVLLVSFFFLISLQLPSIYMSVPTLIFSLGFYESNWC